MPEATTRPLKQDELEGLLRDFLQDWNHPVVALHEHPSERLHRIALARFRALLEGTETEEPYYPTLLTSVSQEANLVRKAVQDQLLGFEGEYGADRLTTADAPALCAALRTLAHMIERDLAVQRRVTR